MGSTQHLDIWSATYFQPTIFKQRHDAIIAKYASTAYYTHSELEAHMCKTYEQKYRSPNSPMPGTTFRLLSTFLSISVVITFTSGKAEHTCSMPFLEAIRVRYKILHGLTPLSNKTCTTSPTRLQHPTHLHSPLHIPSLDSSVSARCSVSSEKSSSKQRGFEYTVLRCAVAE
jgi:hypothetical protein